MSDLFKFAGTTCNNLHDVVAMIKELKTEEEGQKLLKALRGFLHPIADSQLSKFLQKNYEADSERLHIFLKLEIYVKPIGEGRRSRKLRS